MNYINYIILVINPSFYTCFGSIRQDQRQQTTDNIILIPMGQVCSNRGFYFTPSLQSWRSSWRTSARSSCPVSNRASGRFGNRTVERTLDATSPSRSNKSSSVTTPGQTSMGMLEGEHRSLCATPSSPYLQTPTLK